MTFKIFKFENQNGCLLNGLKYYHYFTNEKLLGLLEKLRNKAELKASSLVH